MTSGRDAGMYAYVDAFFPDAEYRKLVVNFAINELGFAERSVDARMTREMAAGEAALAGGDPVVLVEANAGGPYGSAVLAGVQAESERKADRRAKRATKTGAAELSDAPSHTCALCAALLKSVMSG